MSFVLTTCPLCYGERYEQIYEVTDRHYGISGVYRLVRCMTCSLVFLNPMFSDEEISTLYPADYYAYQDHFSQNGWRELAKTLLYYRAETQDPEFPVPGRMLDLGCGTGWFLTVMRDKGWETHGVEISSAATELGRKQPGLNIFLGTLQQAHFPSAFFDYIRSNHSFEHISSPRETLQEIHRVLRPGGKLFVGVPNIDSLNAKLFGQYWWYLGAPVHPFSYSVETLSQLLQEHDFSIERVNYNSSFAGILGSFQIFLNRANGKKSTDGLFVDNPLLKVPCHWAAKLIDLFRLGDSIEITAAKATS